jgi:hypothetical protein
MASLSFGALTYQLVGFGPALEQQATFLPEPSLNLP